MAERSRKRGPDPIKARVRIGDLLRRLTASLAIATTVLLPAACPRSTPSPTAVEFRDRVLAVLEKEFPNERFEKTDDPEVLKNGESEYGLQNLRAKFLTEDDPSQAALVELVREHFTAGLASVESAEALPIDWEVARQLLRPQLMPAEYLDRMPLARKSFGAGLVQGFVIDRPDTYEYVLSDDVARWGVTLEQLDQVALENLDAVSEGVEVHASKGPEALLVVGVQDGYDAARLLSPRFRKSVAGRLGSPFYAAIPNRDFLVMWPSTASASFHTRMREQALRDSLERPYPLTAAVLEVSPTRIQVLPPQ